MIEFKTEKGEFVAKSFIGLPLCTSRSVKMFDFQTNIYIINGLRYECLFKLSEATEDDAKGVVDYEWFDMTDELFCRDYLSDIYDNYDLTSALDSLHSLLKSKGIDINSGNWYLFKKI